MMIGIYWWWHGIRGVFLKSIFKYFRLALLEMWPTVRTMPVVDTVPPPGLLNWTALLNCGSRLAGCGCLSCVGNVWPAVFCGGCEGNGPLEGLGDDGRLAVSASAMASRVVRHYSRRPPALGSPWLMAPARTPIVRLNSNIRFPYTGFMLGSVQSVPYHRSHRPARPQFLTACPWATMWRSPMRINSRSAPRDVAVAHRPAPAHLITPTPSSTAAITFYFNITVGFRTFLK